LFLLLCLLWFLVPCGCFRLWGCTDHRRMLRSLLYFLLYRGGLAGCLSMCSTIWVPVWSPADIRSWSFSLQCIPMSLFGPLGPRSKIRADCRREGVCGNPLGGRRVLAKTCGRRHRRSQRTSPVHRLYSWFLFYLLCGLLRPPWIFPSYSRIVLGEVFLVALDRSVDVRVSLFLWFFPAQLITLQLFNYYYFSAVLSSFIYPKVVPHFRIISQSLHITIQCKRITPFREFSRVVGYSPQFSFIWTQYIQIHTHHR